MFKADDRYFSLVECPFLNKYDKCDILNCIFKHSDRSNIKKRFTDDEDREGTASKKVLTEETKEKDVRYIIPKAINHLSLSRSLRTYNAKRIAEVISDEKHYTPKKEATNIEYNIASQSESTKDYDEKIKLFFDKHQKRSEEDASYLMPKQMMPGAPATIQERLGFIKQMLQVIKEHDKDCLRPANKAIEEEHRVALSSSTNTYKQQIKKKIYELSHPEKFRVTKKHISEEQYLQKLKELIIEKEKLARYGYIMEVPEAQVPNEIRTCKRCGIQFKLEDQLNKIECHYHPGKKIKKDTSVRVYECCGGLVGDSDYCTVSSHHVYHWENAGEMQFAAPFKKTSEEFSHGPLSFAAVGIDCEMGYTTRGFELLRITAVDFFSGEEVLDILVQPKGEVVDLNTRWSGISEITPDAVTFEDLISLLGEVVGPSTILIGHGLENDVNAMRLIHENIIDTAILYPKHQTSPTFRYPLKYLTFKYLGRTIQSGEHDSKEDSLAAIDVVKYFINQDI